MKVIFDLIIFVGIASGISTYLGMKFVEWLEYRK